MTAVVRRLRRYFSCALCHGTGTYKRHVNVSFDSLSPRLQAEWIVLGGPFYREVPEPCPRGHSQP